MPHLRSHWLAPLALVPALFPGCVCSRGGPPVDVPRDFGAVSAPAVDATLAATCLRSARAVLEHGPAVEVPAAPGRLVGLAFYRPGVEPIVATGNGATLALALAAATGALAPKVPDAHAGRLELDVATGAEATTLDDDRDEPLTGIGISGLLVARDGAAPGAVLPGEIVQRHLFRDGKETGLDRPKLRALLAARAGVMDADLGALRGYRFRVDSFVESAEHDRALRVVRGAVARPSEATPELLLGAVKRGADYLARMVNAEGKYVYRYHPPDNRDDVAFYNWLRHSGATYALFEAYEESGDARILAKAELALQYLKAHLIEDAPSGGKYILDGNDEEQQKSGAAGIALVAFTKHAATTGKRTELETMRALARFIMKQQYADGHFRANADLAAETGKKLSKEPVYYQGEATLGLMRLYALDPQAAYLDAARRSADWVVHVRDAPVSEDNQEHDHWISYALNDLYRVTRDPAYVEHAAKIARAILKKERGADAPASDLVATFYNGATTPASTRVEAFDADIALSRFAGKPDAWLVGPARDIAATILAAQFTPDSAFWVANPGRADGGVRESLFVHDVQIDYVQHAMSAWLHLARILRDPTYGASGIPSQDPVRAAPSP